MLFGFEISPDQAENPIGLVGIGGPDLRAINEVVITFVIGTACQAGQIRTCIGLTVALAPTDFSMNNFGDISMLLLLATGHWLDVQSL